MSVFEEFEDDEDKKPPKSIEAQTVDQLIDRAQHGEHSTFEFIRNIESYQVATVFRHAVHKIAKSFDKSAKQLFDQYLKNTGELKCLIAARQMSDVSEFYVKEAAIADDMLSEYRAYCRKGFVIDQLMGAERDVHDLRDFRKKK